MGGDEGIENPARTRVFVSYSRRDTAFVRDLAAALEARGYFVDFDQGADPAKIDGGIAPSDKWWERLKANIAAADVVIFLVSPDSVASRICEDEIVEAERLSKRLIPVLVREIDFAGAPVSLAALHVAISFAGEPFDAALDRLCAALDTDIGWLREGRRLIGQALEWQGGGRLADRLLFGIDIGSAEAWAIRRPPGAPPPSDLVVEFIAASREAESERLLAEKRAVRRTRRLQRFFGMAVVAAALILVLGTWVVMAIVSAQNRRASDALALLAADASVEGDQERAARFALAGIAGSDSILTGFDAGAALAALRPAAAFSPRVRRLMPSGGSFVTSAVMSPDGRLIVADLNHREALLWDAATGAELARFTPSTGQIETIAISPDSKRLLLTTRTGEKPTVETWDLASRKPLARISRGYLIASAAFSPDSAGILVVGEGGATLWDAGSATEIRAFTGSGYIRSMRFSPDGTRVMGLISNGGLQLWDTRSGALLPSPNAGEIVSDAVFSPDGNWIFSASDQGFVRVFETATGLEDVARLIAPGEGKLQSLILSPNGRRLGTMSEDYRTFSVWDLTAALPARLSTLTGGAIWLAAPIFSNDGDRVLLVTSRGELKLFDAETGAEESVTAPARFASSAGFASDGRTVLAAGEGVSLWDFSRARPLHRFAGGRDMRIGAVASPDKSRVLAHATGQPAAILDTATGKVVCRLDDLTGALTAAAFSPDATRLAAALADGSILVFDAAAGRLKAGLTAGQGEVIHIAFAPDGSWLAADSNDNVVRLWRTGEREARILTHDGNPAQTILFLPEGDLLIVWSDGAAMVIDPATGTERGRLPEKITQPIALSPDGRTMATGGWLEHGEILIWDLAGRRVLARLPNERFDLLSVSFSPDSRTLVTGWQDGSILLFDAATGSEISRVRGPSAAYAAVLSPDGHFLATASDGGPARIWDMDARHPVAALGTQAANIAFLESAASVLLLNQSGSAEIWAIDHPALREERAALVARTCQEIVPGSLSILGDKELRMAPFLDRILDADPCHPATIWLRAAYALGIEDWTTGYTPLDPRAQPVGASP